MTALPPDQAPDIAALDTAHQAAADALDAAKATCSAACDGPNADVAAIDPVALAPAVAAHHVLTSIAAGNDPTVAATAAVSPGPGNATLSMQHLQLVAAGAQAAREGGDVLAAVGADASHVELLKAAAAAHESHRGLLEEAYRRFAEAARALVALGGRG